ncbi:heme exporter protein CcmD [Psychrobium sp. nBUS_13]|uniref:heme exporter protein CcmD n=1 Tax=Psychrobium sp. nBUS_13 TaxID=3395319 RepID=UPI003EBC3EB4
MHFDSFSDFIAMGGHAFYVWWAYGITFTLLTTLTIVSVRRKNSLLKEIAKRAQHEDKLKQMRKDKKTNESKT